MNDKQSVSSVGYIKSKIKVVFLGDQSAGKTSILLRFLHDKFEEGLGATVGIDFMAANLTVGQHVLRLQLWDTAGQERFRSLIPSYLKDAIITFIVFDLTNERSFHNLNQWFDLCAQNKKEKTIVMLLGNKLDLAESERAVSTEEAKEKAAQYNVKYMEISAKTNQNIKEAFTFAGEEFIQQNHVNQMSMTNINTLQNGTQKKQDNYKVTLNGKALNQTSQNENVSRTASTLSKIQKRGCC